MPLIMFRQRLLKCARTLVLERSASVSSQASQFEIPRKTRAVKDTAFGCIESGTPRLRMAASLNNRKHRERHNRIILEGWRLISEALLAKASPVAIFYSDPKLLDQISVHNLPKNCLAQVSRDTMESISNAVTPPGMVGMFKRPRQGGDNQSQRVPTVPITVLCDGLKDPTNLGTLVRTCAAAGCESLITSQGCVDVWDPKVLRCAAGGHFYLPIHYNLSWDKIGELLPQDKKIFLADSNKPDDLKMPSYDHYKVDWTLGPSLLVIGGETAGLGETVKNSAWQRKGQLVRVPMATPIDSLSAAIAGTVIIYEAYRQTVSAQEAQNWVNNTKKWQL